MSNYGQQPPYGQNPPQPYGQPQAPNPYGPPPPPYGRPGQPPYGQPQPPYGQPGPPNPYGQQPGPNPYGQQPGQGQPGPPYGPASGPSANSWTPQPSAPKKPELVERSIPVVTMDAVPGREVTEVVGEVMGVVVRSRELPPELRGGNPAAGYVVMLTQSRQDAVSRMVEMAQAAGANAVVGLRLDCSEITQSLSEVSAYGTAVKLAETADATRADEDEQGAPAESAATDEGIPAGAGDADGDLTSARPAEAQQQPSGPAPAQQWPPASSWPPS